MTSITPRATDKVYSCGETCRVERHRVWQTEFHSFCLNLQKLKRALGVMAEEDFWNELLWPLLRYRRQVSCTPLCFDHPAVWDARLPERLRRHIAHCEQLYPRFGAPASALLDDLDAVSRQHQNPMLEVIATLCASYRTTKAALLLKETSMIPALPVTLGEIQELRHLELVTAAQLRRGECFDVLFITGPARLQPEYVLSSPRANSIHVVHYGWIQDAWKHEPAFISSSLGKASISRTDRASAEPCTDHGLPQGVRADVMDAEDLLPPINWQGITSRALESGPGDFLQEDITARLFLFEDHTAALLDAEEGSSALVIDLDEETVSRVKRIPVRDIAPGMFILLRTGGGGDYIVPMADRIMGERSSYAREQQRFWKARLREAIESESVLGVAVHLLDLGSGIANEMNVRNWASERSIKTRDYQDFAAIMRLLDLEDRTREYWDTMCKIDSAHRKAGGHIRKLLLRRVLDADFRELERSGRMDFELAEADGGSLTALRVADISPEPVTAPSSRLMHVFDLEAELWRG